MAGEALYSSIKDHPPPRLEPDGAAGPSSSARAMVPQTPETTKPKLKFQWRPALIGVAVLSALLLVIIAVALLASFVGLRHRTPDPELRGCEEARRTLEGQSPCKEHAGSAREAGSRERRRAGGGPSSRPGEVSLAAVRGLANETYGAILLQPSRGCNEILCDLRCPAGYGLRCRPSGCGASSCAELGVGYALQGGQYRTSRCRASPSPAESTCCRCEAVVLYFVGTDGAGRCPGGSVGLSEAECRGMPRAFGGMLHDPFVVDSPGDPAGCFRLAGPHGFYYFNPRPAGGGGGEGRTPYCKRPHIAEYVAGADGAGRCAYGTGPLGERECREIPRLFGGAPHRPFRERSATDPGGCFRLSGAHGFYYYNAHPNGSGRAGRTPYCKREYAAKYVAGTNGANSCPRGAVALSEADCRDMPRGFGGTLHAPFVVSSAGDPKGCFRLHGAHGYYYFNTHAIGGGRNGRTPYCKARAS